MRCYGPGLSKIQLALMLQKKLKQGPTRMRLRIANGLLALSIMCFGTTSAQTPGPETIKGNFSSWFLLLNRFQLTKKWSITNELHERTGSFLSDQGQFLWRPSVDYSLNKNVEFSVGYSLIHVNPYAPYNQPLAYTEHNIWEQAILRWDVGKVHFTNRFRLENRWVPHVGKNAEGISYIDREDRRERFRYRFIVSTDIVKFKKENALFFMGWDELWFNMNNKLVPETFARNWLYLGLGYRFNPTTNIQLGYLNQVDRISDTKFIATPIMQLTFVKNFSFIKKETK